MTVPAQVERPQQVTYAVLLLALFPVLIVATVVFTFLALDAAETNADRLVPQLAGRGVVAPESLVGGVLSTIRAQAVAGTVIKAIQAVALGILAIFVYRGSQGARIGVYVVAGLTTVGAVGLVVVTGLRGALRGAIERRVGTAGLVFVDESDVLPGWYTWYNYGAVVVSIALAVAVVALLTRRASNAYFSGGQRPPMPFAPPMPPAWPSGGVPGGVPPAGPPPPQGPPGPPTGPAYRPPYS